MPERIGRAVYKVCNTAQSKGKDAVLFAALGFVVFVYFFWTYSNHTVLYRKCNASRRVHHVQDWFWDIAISLSCTLRFV